MRLVSNLVVIAMMVSGAGDAFAYQQLSGAVSITSQATKTLTPSAVLDTFDTASTINGWGDVTGTFASQAGTPPVNTASCVASYTNDPAKRYGSSGYSLQLDYNVNNSGSYAGYSSKLGGGSLAPYNAISFWVKGAVGGEFFKVELKNYSTTSYWSAEKATTYYRNIAAAYITNYLDNGVTINWQKVTIPFDNFENLDGFTSMKEFTIVFENTQSDTNGSPKQGTIYIDNIQFETAATFPINVIRVNHFGDKLSIGGFGGNMGSSGGNGGSAAYSFSASQADAGEYHAYPYGLKFDFGLLYSNSYAYVWNIFGGGNADANLAPVTKPLEMGNIPVPHDFSQFTYLTFWARASSGTTQNPAGFKVELKDDLDRPVGAGTPFYVIKYNGSNPLTPEWQKYTLGLTDFRDYNGVALHKAGISQITFTVEGGNSITVGGTIYIDEVQFEK